MLCYTLLATAPAPLPVQGRFISWAPEWRPGHADYSKQAAWAFDNAPTNMPGVSESLQSDVRTSKCALMV